MGKTEVGVVIDFAQDRQGCPFRSLTRRALSRVVRLDHDSPHLQQRLWNVTSMAVLLAPTPQFFRTGAIFMRQAQLADLFLKLSTSR